MVVIAIIAAVTSQAPKGWGYGWAGDFAPALAALVFAGLMFYFWRLANTSTDK
jgi:hypothetical protein